MKESNPQDSGERWGTQWTSRADAAVAQERAAKRAESEKVTSPSERWRTARPSKSTLFWSCIGAIALTLLVGFQWGGWMTANGATSMATKVSNLAVVDRLASICVAQFNLDPASKDKLVAMKALPSYKQATYVTDQKWATMPGEETPTAQVADACAQLIVQKAE
jgi:hypothetical protein